jgi:hypothetical protein
VKILQIVLGFVLFAGFVTSAFPNATATSVTGAVRSESGSAPAKVIRQGDVLRQGETIATGPASSAVLRFEDGQIVALSANSRLAISTYSFNPSTGSGSVLLSLLGGGMRAISGVIARRSPQSVTYRAANVTIGIRGTDTNVIIGAGGVVATVNEGSIEFALPGQTPVVILVGEAAFARSDGTFARGTVQQIAAQLAQSPQGQQVLDALNGLQGLETLLGVSTAPGTTSATGFGITPQPPGIGSSAGGGAASAR